MSSNNSDQSINFYQNPFSGGFGHGLLALSLDVFVTCFYILVFFGMIGVVVLTVLLLRFMWIIVSGVFWDVFDYLAKPFSERKRKRDQQPTIRTTYEKDEETTSNAAR